MAGAKFSVIVPAHNAEATLEAALGAIFKQQCQSGFEVIAVDDASTDRTAELIKKFPARLLALKENLGAGGARNRGAQAASGEILVFVDADVFLQPGALAQIENYFVQNPGVAALVGNYTAMPGDSNFCTVYHNLFTVYHHDLSAERIEWFWGALSAIRRETFEKLSGFSEEYPGASAEDIELGYRLSEAGREIRYFPELRGVHGRRFGLASMLYNDYHKSVLGLKLYLKRKPAGKHPHGFSSPKNGLNLALAPLTALGLLAVPFTYGIPWLIFSIVFLTVNFSFYRYILKNAGARYLVPSVFLHWLSFNVIALGVAGGLLGLALGRGLESKSRWL